MKKLLIFTLILVFSLKLSARNFYFSSLSGNDSRTSTQAQSSLTPWQTLTKLNSFFSSLLSGDSVLLKRGETFYGSITITRSGPIVIGAYGLGAKPVITSLVTLTGWVQSPTNIWTSATNALLPSSLNIVVQNNALQPLGRFPNLNTTNKGYLTFETHTGTNSITDNQLLPSPNWTGAEAAVRVNNTTIERRTISMHSGNTLTFSAVFTTAPTDLCGYFFQNDLRTLDVPGEWYYDPGTKKLAIYSTSIPTAVDAATIEVLVTSTNFNNITFDNIYFKGGNSEGLLITNGSGVIIKNCVVNFSGIEGININNNDGFTIDGDSVLNSLNEGIRVQSVIHATVKNCYIYSSGSIAGMCQDYGGVTRNNGIAFLGSSGTLQNNHVINSGCNGIKFDGDSCFLLQNFIDTFAFIKNDAGGIYTQGGSEKFGDKIINNIILHAIGAKEGSNNPTLRQAEGIYIDKDASNQIITGNSAAYCGRGLFLHGGHNNYVYGNTFYSNEYGWQWWQYATAKPIRTIVAKNNIMFATDATSITGYFRSNTTDIPLFGLADSNYYCRPKKEPNGINNAGSTASGATLVYHNGGSPGYYSLDKWITATIYDPHSKKSPKGYDTLRFEYNASLTSIAVPLNGYTWLDARGVRYKTNITLAPYASAALIRDTIVPVVSNVLPVANAGMNQVITLPTNSVTLTGTGTDADGTIVSYGWVKFSGGSATITTPAAASTTVTGMVAATYVFTLTVTDNSGGTATSNVQVIVNPAPINIIPVSDAGSNQVITLPTSTVNLSGSGSDADGTITAYLWTKFSGGTATITSPSSASTTVTGLAAGAYVFQLRVTDNSGAFGYDTMRVTVNAAPPPNISPTVTTGANQSITLPTDSVSLTSTGNDVDGTISSYQWTQQTALAGTITSPSSQNTTVTGMVAGTYIFKILVTDNLGATGFATTQVVVNPYVNIPPVANAGADSTIALPNGITLDGSNSYDPDGPFVTYSWAKLSGPAYTIDDSTLANPTLSGLSIGTYHIRLTVSDSTGATAYDDMTLTVNPTSLSATVTALPILCNGGNGTITISATGGVPPYSGSIGSYVVSAGTYTYIVVDSVNAQDTVMVTMSEPSAIALTDSIGVITVYNGTATIAIFASGGTAPYTYRLNTIVSGSNYFTISAGNYIGYVTDANGCMSTISFSLTQPLPPPTQQFILKRKHIYY